MHIFKTIAELISANLKIKYSVLAVLTDLIDDWHFFWLRGKIIMRLKLTRTESVVLIRNNLISANKELIELANQASEPTEYPAVGLDRSSPVRSSPKKTGLSTWTGPDWDWTDLNLKK
ncbi:unnamed protein product [Rhizophagus irregularis]|uniref:Uncharacterized protein n=1 Tax=Rhizophagus irregularis TaxID=588596 RepID=A0A915ZWV9_9GLOM|nr:unnamed protein product [Rhizophagus irregularis]